LGKVHDSVMGEMVYVQRYKLRRRFGAAPQGSEYSKLKPAMPLPKQPSCGRRERGIESVDLFIIAVSVRHGSTLLVFA